MRAEWQLLIHKMRGLAPEFSPRLESRANVNILRYLAFLAYEGGEFASACRLLAGGLCARPQTFLADLRNWKLAAASLAGVWLPEQARLRLERLARVRISANERASLAADSNQPPARRAPIFRP